MNDQLLAIFETQIATLLTMRLGFNALGNNKFEWRGEAYTVRRYTRHPGMYTLEIPEAHDEYRSMLFLTFDNVFDGVSRNGGNLRFALRIERTPPLRNRYSVVFQYPDTDEE